MANAQYRSDFSACVNLFKTSLEQMENKAGTPNLQVAAVHQGSNNHDADLNVEDRYYKKGEYDQLTGAQKKGLKLKREKRSHKPGRKDSTSTKGAKVGGTKAKANSSFLNEISVQLPPLLLLCDMMAMWNRVKKVMKRSPSNHLHPRR